MIVPITRKEKLLNAIATNGNVDFLPITREELFLFKILGADVNTPTPITRKELLYQHIIDGTIPTFEPRTRLEKFIMAAAGVGLELPVVLTREEYWWAEISDSAYETITGAIVHFIAKRARAIKSLIANISYTQDLNGYDSPWPAGGGKNKFNGTFLQGYWAYADGTWVNSPNWITTEKIPCKASTSYTVSADAKATRWQGFVWYDSNGDFISTDNLNSNVNIGLTKTSPSNAAYLIFNIAGYPGSNDTIAPSDVTYFQLEEGSSSTAYAPYSNICPISGWTGANVTRTGKNLANDAEFSIEEPSWSTAAHWLGLSKNADGTFTITRPIGWGGNGFVYVGTYKAGTYKLSFDLISTADVNCGATCAIKKKGTWTTGAAAASITGLTVAGRHSLNDFTITEDCDVWFAVGPYVDNGAQVISGNYQVELGSTATAYEPYSGDTYSITFPSEAGTVYGGTLDVTTGKLTVDRAMVDLGAKNWYPSTAAGRTRFRTSITDIERISSPNVRSSLLCSNYPTKTANQTYQGTTGVSLQQNSADIYIYDPQTESMTTAEFKSAMSGVQLCYGLATPIVYDLTPTEVTTLLGDNTIWADTGDVSVTY